jgi:PEP-CTERM motif
MKSVRKNKMYRLASLAAIVLMLSAPGALATVTGVTVDGLGSSTGVGTTVFRSALGGNAVKYYIPLTAAPATCTFGVDCGTVADSGSGGTVMSMFMKFNPVSTTEASWLEILFEDLDLAGANDPFGFLETVEVFNGSGTSLTGLITDISNSLVTGDFDTQQLLSFGLGVLGSTPLWLELRFSSNYIYTGTNTPEFLIATVSSVPEPATLGILGLGLLGLGLARHRRT